MSKGNGNGKRSGSSDSKAGRTGNGQFQPGHTGNPKGRPIKEKPMPKSLADSLGAAFGEEVPVQGPNGKPELLTLLELCVKTAVRGALKMNPKEILWLLQLAERCGAFDAMREQAEEFVSPFTEEDRRLLEIAQRDLPYVDEEELCRQRNRLAANAQEWQRHCQEMGEPVPDFVRDCLD